MSIGAYTLLSYAKKKISGALSHHKAHTSREIHDYIIEHSCRPDKQLRDLLHATITDTGSIGAQQRMISPLDSAAVLQMIVQLVRAKKIVEIGVFTGFTTLAMAKALPEDGKIIACDVSKEFTDFGRPFWKDAGVDAKIDLRIGDARATMSELLDIERGENGTFDVVFIDADKANYDAYYELGLQLLRVGGVVVIDNVLWHGRVLPSLGVWGLNPITPDTEAICALNDKVFEDARVRVCMIPTSDGMTIAMKL